MMCCLCGCGCGLIELHFPSLARPGTGLFFFRGHHQRFQLTQFIPCNPRIKRPSFHSESMTGQKSLPLRGSHLNPILVLPCCFVLISHAEPFWVGLSRVCRLAVRDMFRRNCICVCVLESLPCIWFFLSNNRFFVHLHGTMS